MAGHEFNCAGDVSPVVLEAGYNEGRVEPQFCEDKGDQPLGDLGTTVAHALPAFFKIHQTELLQVLQPSAECAALVH